PLVSLPLLERQKRRAGEANVSYGEVSVRGNGSSARFMRARRDTTPGIGTHHAQTASKPATAAPYWNSGMYEPVQCRHVARASGPTAEANTVNIWAPP